MRSQIETDIRSENSETTTSEEQIATKTNSNMNAHKNPQGVSKILESYEALIASNNAKINQLMTDLQLTRQKLAISETRYSTLTNIIEGKNQAQLNDLLDKIDQLEKKVFEQRLQIRKLKAQKLHQNKCVQSEGLIERINLSSFVNMAEIKPSYQVFKRKRKNSLQEQQNSIPWKKILEKYHQYSNDCEKFKQKTLPMIKKFIPHEERSKIWPLIFENKLGITDTLYIELLERRNHGLLQSYVQNQIQKDIQRSFSRQMKASQKQVLASQLRQILHLFHLLRPDVSYVQGMTYPVIILISVVGKFEAFKIFTNLVISNQFFRRMYTFQDNYIEIYCNVFEEMLRQFQPTVYAHLNNLGIKPEIYLIEWFFTLFCRGLSIETTLKIWDMIGYQQEVVLYRIGLAIFQIVSKSLLVQNYERSIAVIRSFWTFIDQNKLLQVAIKYHIILSQSKLDKMIKKFEKNTSNIYLRQSN